MGAQEIEDRVAQKIANINVARMTIDCDELDAIIAENKRLRARENELLTVNSRLALERQAVNTVDARVERDRRQTTVLAWAKRCGFPMEHTERALRFIEEAVELTQAMGVDIEHVKRVIEFVYGRPKGSIESEVGGVSLTLLVLCERLGISTDQCETKELMRVLSIDEEVFHKRNAAKMVAGLTTIDR